MHWLPSVPTDFRDHLRAAGHPADPRQRWQHLAALASTRLGYVETIQLDRALVADSAARATAGRAVRVAVVGTGTVDHLAPSLRVAGLRHGLAVEPYTGAYGQYRAELCDPQSALQRFGPEVVLLSLDAREALAGIAVDAATQHVEAALDAIVADWAALWQQARDTTGAAIVQQTVLDTSQPLFGGHDRMVAGTPFRVVARLNDKVAEAAATQHVALVDVARAAAHDGLDAWFDRARWLQAKMEIAPQAAPMFAELFMRVVVALRGRSRKCLVLDLDDTIWGGIVGEVGLSGLVLGQGSAQGEAFAALQRHAKSLAERGVILAVCSKNDPKIVEAVFRDHPEMVLRRADIAAFVANWEDKATNLCRIAEQLNIGVDSLVFVDDNPAERARVRESLPEVAVPELPKDPSNYVRCIAEAGYFESVAFTSDDRKRAARYTVDAERAESRGATQSLDDFLRSLEMSVLAGPLLPVDIDRATQLLNKTNQFNTTGQRYSADEVATIAADPTSLALQFRLLDRFGDNGLVSVMLLRPAPDAADTLEIENWVMSCRVFGRQLELEAVNIAVDAARRRGIRTLRATLRTTERNGVVRSLFPMLGFAPLTAADAGDSLWALPLDDHRAHPTHIRRQERSP